MIEFMKDTAFWVGCIWLFFFYLRCMRLLVNLITVAWTLRGWPSEGLSFREKVYNIFIFTLTGVSFTLINKEDETQKREWKKF